MDAKAFPVLAVLGDQKRFVVPIYQRQYSWREKRLQPFWDDVVAKANETLVSKPKFQHYMGALIIAPGTDGYKVGTTPKVQVVDGQQRLTTFQLFLAAVREIAERLKRPDIAKSLEGYVLNDPRPGDTEARARLKLVPTPADRQVFHDIMDTNWAAVRVRHPEHFYQKGTLRWGQAPNSLRAFAYFIDRIEAYVRFGISDEDETDGNGERAEDDAETQHTRLQALLDALLLQLKLVVITLEEGDDAQVIFETLNSKAEPLLAMDLVRNNIFHRAEAQGESAEQLFEAKWKPFDEPFWKADAPRAKPQRPRIDHFLSHALTAQTGNEASLRELYAEYRGFARPKGQPRFGTVQEELEALLRFAPVYRMLEEAPGDEPLAKLGHRLTIWEVATAYPLVFTIAVSEVDEMEKAELYTLIYAYIVRRAVCGLTAKNLNKNFQRIIGIFLRRGVSRSLFAESFADQTGPAVRFPSDAEFRGAIRDQPVYQTILKKERLVDILWELELSCRDKFMASSDRPAFLSVEHVLPQSWAAQWPLSDRRTAPADGVTGADEAMLQAIAVRNRVLHTLGNLTLATGPLNSSMSNDSFVGKCADLKESLLALNLYFAKATSWDETAIRNRADALADRAVTIWPAVTSS